MNGSLDWSRDGKDWPHPEASRFIEAGGLRWHVQCFGDAGPVLLLLHGTGASGHSFRDLVPRLHNACRLVIPDLPGHAFTSAPAAARMGLPDMAAAVAQLLEKLGVQPDYVCGHSAGAAVALEMTRAGLIAPGAVIGINAALSPYGGKAGMVFPALARLFMVNPFVVEFFRWQAGDLAAIRRLMESTGSHLSPEGLEYYRRLFRSRSHVQSTLAMMAHWRLEGLRAALPGLVTPLVLVVGQDDHAVSPSDARIVARMKPGTLIRTLPRLGHLCHEEAPEAVAAILLDHVSAPVQRESGAA